MKALRSGAADGTPAFVINGYYIAGAEPEAAFKKLIELALSGKPVNFPPTPATSPTTPATTAGMPADSIEGSHILVQYAGAMRASDGITRSKGEARTLALQIMKMAKNHADFGDLAAKYSDEPGAAERDGVRRARPMGGGAPLKTG